jgi:hypothetical protein
MRGKGCELGRAGRVRQSGLANGRAHAPPLPAPPIMASCRWFYMPLCFYI